MCNFNRRVNYKNQMQKFEIKTTLTEMKNIFEEFIKT